MIVKHVSKTARPTLPVYISPPFSPSYPLSHLAVLTRGVAAHATQQKKNKVDPYTLPARRSVLSVRDGPERHLIEDIAIDTVIGVMDENGTIVGQLDSFVMQFS